MSYINLSSVKKNIVVSKFVCNVCKMTFVSQRFLKEHSAIHESSNVIAKNEGFKCELCDRSFYQQSTLSAHMSVHFKSALFKCTLCPKSFQTRENLIEHNRLHVSQLSLKGGKTVKISGKGAAPILKIVASSSNVGGKPGAPVLKFGGGKAAAPVLKIGGKGTAPPLDNSSTDEASDIEEDPNASKTDTKLSLNDLKNTGRGGTIKIARPNIGTSDLVANDSPSSPLNFKTAGAKNAGTLNTVRILKPSPFKQNTSAVSSEGRIEAKSDATSSFAKNSKYGTILKYEIDGGKTIRIVRPSAAKKNPDPDAGTSMLTKESGCKFDSLVLSHGKVTPISKAKNANSAIRFVSAKDVLPDTKERKINIVPKAKASIKIKDGGNEILQSKTARVTKKQSTAQQEENESNVDQSSALDDISLFSCTKCTDIFVTSECLQKHMVSKHLEDSSIVEEASTDDTAIVENQTINLAGQSKKISNQTGHIGAIERQGFSSADTVVLPEPSNSKPIKMISSRAEQLKKAGITTLTDTDTTGSRGSVNADTLQKPKSRMFCSVCKIPVRDQNHLQNHDCQPKPAVEVNKLYCCHFCIKYYKHKNNIMDHLRTVHGDEPDIEELIYNLSIIDENAPMKAFDDAKPDVDIVNDNANEEYETNEFYEEDAEYNEFSAQLVKDEKTANVEPVEENENIEGEEGETVEFLEENDEEQYYARKMEVQSADGEEKKQENDETAYYATENESDNVPSSDMVQVLNVDVTDVKAEDPEAAANEEMEYYTDETGTYLVASSGDAEVLNADDSNVKSENADGQPEAEPNDEVQYYTDDTGTYIVASSDLAEALEADDTNTESGTYEAEEGLGEEMEYYTDETGTYLVASADNVQVLDANDTAIEYTQDMADEQNDEVQYYTDDTGTYVVADDTVQVLDVNDIEYKPDMTEEGQDHATLYYTDDTGGTYVSAEAMDGMNDERENNDGVQYYTDDTGTYMAVNADDVEADFADQVASNDQIQYYIDENGELVEVTGEDENVTLVRVEEHSKMDESYASAYSDFMEVMNVVERQINERQKEKDSTRSQIEVDSDMVVTEKWDCTLCLESFPTEQGLNEHERMHSMTDGRFLCQYCTKTYSCKPGLVKHIQIHHENGRYRCDLCSEIFTLKRDLHAHVSMHMGFTDVKSALKITRMGLEDIPLSERDMMGALIDDKEIEVSNDVSVEADPSDVSNGKWTCKICTKSFNTKIGAKAHYENHLNTNRPTCKICHRTFLNKYVLKTHYKVHNKSLKFNCKICYERFKYKPEMVGHMKEHMGLLPGTTFPKKCLLCETDIFYLSEGVKHANFHLDFPAGKYSNRPLPQAAALPSAGANHAVEIQNQNEMQWECKICLKKSKTKAAAEAHIRTHLQRPEFECAICQKLFLNKYYLKAHLKIHLRPQQVCKFCNAQFPNKRDLRFHEKTHLPKKPPPVPRKVPEAERTIECDICQKMYPSRKSVNNHIRIHHSENLNYACQYCGQKLVNNLMLQQHYRSRRRRGRCPNKAKPNEHLYLWQCHSCNVSFRFRPDMMRHVKTHMTSANPSDALKCALCSAEFNNNDAFVEHALVHIDGPTNVGEEDGARPFVGIDSRKKPYECEICFKAFSDQNKMAKHMKIHRLEKPYKCRFCKASFHYRLVMETHCKRFHFQEFPYRCEHCFLPFLHRREMKFHMNSHADLLADPTRVSYCNYDAEIVVAPDVNRAGRKGFEYGEHKQVQIGDKMFYQCDLCPKYVKTIAYLRAHMQMHLNPQLAFNCNVCRRKFPYHNMLKRHYRTHVKNSPSYKLHLEDSRKPRPSTQLDEINQRLANTKKGWKHIDRQTASQEAELDYGALLSDAPKRGGNGEDEVGKMVCSVCSATFHTEKKLQSHLKAYEQFFRYQCPICFLACPYKANLVRHMACHATDKPSNDAETGDEENAVVGDGNSQTTGQYACEHCPRVLQTMIGWKVHTTKHLKGKLAPGEGELLNWTFKCDLCGTVFGSKQVLDRHMKVHTKPPKFKCPLCDEHFFTKRDVPAHLKTVHDEDVPTCKYCNAEFVTDLELKVHERIHGPKGNEINRGRLRYRCEECDEYFGLIRDLQEHQELTGHKFSLANGGRFLECKVCNATFHRKRDVVEHEQLTGHEIYGTTPRPVLLLRSHLECKECNTSFSRKRDLTEHKELTGHDAPDTTPKKTRRKRRIVAASSVSSKKPKVDYVCSICSKTFSNEANLQRHTALHERPPSEYKCLICVRSFSNEANLNRHNALHERPPSHRCDECGALFHFNRDLPAHMRQVHSKKTYLCALCPRECMTEAQLNVHAASHRKNARELKCLICDRSFDTMLNLLAHKKVHSKPPSIQCPKCDESFHFKRQLPPHLREVHGDVVHGCGSCKREFVTEEELKAHEATHGEDGLKCQICNREFAKACNLRRHAEVHSKTPLYKCTKCESCFHFWREVSAHLRQVHSIMPESCAIYKKQFAIGADLEAEVVDYRCETCNKCFTTKHSFLSHNEIHAKPPTYQCNKCEAWFHFFRTLTAHLRDVHEVLAEQPSIYKRQFDNHDDLEEPSEEATCTLCKRTFYDKRSLVEHNKIHAAPPKHACLKCEVFLHFRREIPAHMREVHGEITHSCATCQREFVTEDDLRKHEGGHIEIGTDLTCHICNVVLGARDALFKHNIIHSKPPAYFCKVCDKSFHFYYVLAKHIRDDHELLPEGHKVYKKENVAEADMDARDVSDKFKCSICNAKLRDESSLSRHTKIHSDPPSIHCTECDAVFHFKRELPAHLRLVHSKKTVLCTYSTCDREFAKENDLKHHETCHLDINPELRCRICDRSYTTRESFVRHQKQHASPPDQQCKRCDAFFHFQYDLYAHQRQCNAKAHACSSCASRFDTEEELTQHNLTHATDHICLICDRTFARKRYLVLHNEVHAKPPTVKCPQCDVLLHFKRQIPAHVREAHANTIHICGHCDREFVSEEELKAHEPYHAEVAVDLKCTLCDLTFVNKHNLLRHNEGHSKEPTYRCKVCRGTFHYTRELRIHYSQKHPERPEAQERSRKSSTLAEQKPSNPQTASYQCNKCEAWFFHYRSLSKHVREVHGLLPQAKSIYQKEYDHYEDSDEATEPNHTTDMRTDLKCLECDITLSSKRSLLKHTQIHIKPPTYSCNICDLAFHFYRALDTHLRQIHDVFPGPLPGYKRQFVAEADMDAVDVSEDFKCKICERNFRDEQSLSRHTKIHDDPPTFSCTDCDSLFHFRPDFAAHLRTVHSKPTHPCTDCQREFVTEEDLKDHALFHVDKERDLKCQICDITFSEKSSAARHQKQHSMPPKYQCQNCEACFHFRSDLTAHRRECTSSTSRDTEDELAEDNSSHDLGLRCSLCNVTFANKSNLVRHNEVHSQEPTLSCKDCKAMFHFARELRIHCSTEHPQRSETQPSTSAEDLKCLVCDRFFSSKQNLARHRRLHSKRPARRCATCGAQFHFQKELLEHMQQLHPEVASELRERPSTSIEDLKCFDCDQVFSSRQGLTSHNMKFHPEKVGDVTGKLGGPFKCDQCDASYKHQRNLYMHKKRHADDAMDVDEVECKEEPLTSPLGDSGGRRRSRASMKCEKCDILFKYKSDLIEHKKEHESTSDEEHISSQEDVADPLLSQLAEIHEDAPIARSKAKRSRVILVCDQCHACFSFRRDLDAHKREHEAKKEQASAVEKSGVSSKGADPLLDLAEILGDDDAEKNRARKRSRVSLICDRCDAYFLYKRDLDAHKIEHEKLDARKASTSNAEAIDKDPIFDELNLIHGDKFGKVDLIFVEPPQIHEDDDEYDDVDVEQFDTDPISIEGLKGRSHICRQCKQSFRTEVQLLRHCVSHITLPRIRCERIDHFFDFKRYLYKCQVDLTQHKGPSSAVTRSKVCKTCQSSFRTERELVAHRRECGNRTTPLARNLICSVCNSKFSSNRDLMEHKKKHMLKCGKCDKVFANAQTLARHAAVHAEVTPESSSESQKSEVDYMCKKCNIPFQSRRDLAAHNKTHAAPIVKENTQKPKIKFSCKECKISFPGKNDYLLHRKQHASGGPYKCNFCNRAYMGKFQLQRHRKTHSNQPYFICGKCNSVFKSKELLIDHRKNHSDMSKMKKCEVCEKFIAIDSIWELHEMFHPKKAGAEAEKSKVSLKCQKCSASFQSLSDLIAHRKEHSGPSAAERKDDVAKHRNDLVDKERTVEMEVSGGSTERMERSEEKTIGMNKGEERTESMEVDEERNEAVQLSEKRTEALEVSGGGVESENERSGAIGELGVLIPSEKDLGAARQPTDQTDETVEVIQGENKNEQGDLLTKQGIEQPVEGQADSVQKEDEQTIGIEHSEEQGPIVDAKEQGQMIEDRRDDLSAQNKDHVDQTAERKKDDNPNVHGSELSESTEVEPLPGDFVEPRDREKQVCDSAEQGNDQIELVEDQPHEQRIEQGCESNEVAEDDLTMRKEDPEENKDPSAPSAEIIEDDGLMELGKELGEITEPRSLRDIIEITDESTSDLIVESAIIHHVNEVDDLITVIKDEIEVTEEVKEEVTELACQLAGNNGEEDHTAESSDCEIIATDLEPQLEHIEGESENLRNEHVNDLQPLDRDVAELGEENREMANIGDQSSGLSELKIVHITTVQHENESGDQIGNEQSCANDDEPMDVDLADLGDKEIKNKEDCAIEKEGSIEVEGGKDQEVIEGKDEQLSSKMDIEDHALGKDDVDDQMEVTEGEEIQMACENITEYRDEQAGDMPEL